MTLELLKRGPLNLLIYISSLHIFKILTHTYLETLNAAGHLLTTPQEVTPTRRKTLSPFSTYEAN